MQKYDIPGLSIAISKGDEFIQACNFSRHYETGGGNSYYICGDRNYWDRCGDVEDSNSNKEEGELSDGEGFVCQSGPYRWVAI